MYMQCASMCVQCTRMAYCRSTLSTTMSKYSEEEWRLYAACAAGPVAEVRSQLQEGHVHVDQQISGEGAALHAAALWGQDEVVRALVQEFGANVNHVCGWLGSPLRGACWGDRRSTVETLVGLGADPNTQGSDGSSALHVASRLGHVGPLTVLLDTGRCRVDLRDIGGHTPLHLAAAEGRGEAVALLVGGGASVNVKNNQVGIILHRTYQLLHRRLTCISYLNQYL